MNLEDIARKAGVSRSTVSRVLNNERYVSEDVRVRVQAIIDAEGFRPNPAARALVTRRSRLIGMAISQTTNVFFGENSYYPMLLQGIAEGVNHREYAMLLWLAETSEQREKFNRRVIRDRTTDGVIITSVMHDDPLYAYLTAHKRRFVMVETPPHHNPNVSCVTIDNAAAAEVLVSHLVSLGRRRIATIAGPANNQDAIDRFEGYKRGLAKAGLPLDPNLVVKGLYQREAGLAGAAEIMKHRPDAVVCGGDTIAIGVMDALAQAGVRVPDDVAVTGFDDLDVAAMRGLTTVSHSLQKVGFTAANLLIDLIEGQLEHPQQIVLPTHLVMRRSTVPGA